MARRSSIIGMGALGRTAYQRTVNINTFRGMSGIGYMGDDDVYDASIYDTAAYETWSPAPSVPQPTYNNYYYATNPVPVQTLPNGQTIYSTQGNGAIVQTAGSAGPGTSAYGTGTLMDSIKQALQLAPAVIGVKNMDALQKMNMERLQRGQPLLTAQQMAQMTTPVNFGLTPQVSQMLLIGGIAMIAVMAMKKH